MKAKITILVSVVALVLTFYFFNTIYCWVEFRKNTDTPEQFLNETRNKNEDYTKDSLKISTELKSILLKHEDFFYSKEFYEGTDIIVDTIVYSSDLNQTGILILVKNPTSRQLISTKSGIYYYTAAAYLGVRQKDTFDLSWLGPNFTNSTDSQKLSKSIREACFRTFVTKDTTGKYAYKYNLNDIRFWTSNIWQKIDEDKLKRREFEREKLVHPENVYEPTR